MPSSTGTWGEPLVANDSAFLPPSDLNALSALIVARGVRHFTTQALLAAASGGVDGYVAFVDAIPGIPFVRESGAWVMRGEPIFTNAAARDAAITAPATGMRSRILTELFSRSYSSGAWRAVGSRLRMLPSSVVNLTAGPNGSMTSGAVSSFSVNGCFTADARGYEIFLDCTISASNAISAVLRAAGVDAATAYDTQRGYTSAGTSFVATQSANTTNFVVTGIGSLGRQIVRMTLEAPQTTDPTVGMSETFATGTTAAMTTAAAKASNGLYHRTASAFDGFSMSVASGTMTVNSLVVEGINN